MKKCLLLSVAVLFFITVFIVQTRAADQSLLIIGAAASFNPVLDELEVAFEKQHLGVDVRFHTGSSGMIARQVEAHAPIDAIMIASKKEADSLRKQGLIDMANPAGFLTNRLVIVEQANGETNWPNVETIVMGTPGAVPVGTYAEQALNEIEMIRSTRIYAKDASSVLMWTASGEADAGIVYETDARSSQDVQVSYVFPENTHDKIIYNAGVAVQSDHPAAEAFEAFVMSKEAASLFEKHGFRAGGEESQ